MAEDAPRTFGEDFKRFFLRGLAVLLPSVLTLWIVFTAYRFVDTNIAEPINRGVRVALNRTAVYYEPMAAVWDPTENQLDAEIAERAINNGIVKRSDIESAVRQRTGESPGQEELFAEIADREDVQAAINRESIRLALRQRNIFAWWIERWYMNLIGLVIAIVSVYIAGRLLGGFFGRRIYRRIESFLMTLPVFKQVYPHVKQIVDFVFSDDQRLEFNRVVVVEYPRKGIWSIGFVTGNTMKGIARASGDSVTVFIPSSPTPFTGYTITVPRSETLELPISIDEALRFTVSGGVLIPEHQRVISDAASTDAAGALPQSRKPAKETGPPSGDDTSQGSGSPGGREQS